MQAFQPWKDMVGILSGKWALPTSKHRDRLEVIERDEHLPQQSNQAAETQRWERNRFSGRLQRIKPLM